MSCSWGKSSPTVNKFWKVSDSKRHAVIGRLVLLPEGEVNVKECGTTVILGIHGRFL